MRVTNTKTFIERCISIYKDEYVYNNTIYTSTFDNIIITCKKHGDFNTIPNRFLRGKGCPKCSKELIQYESNNNLKNTFKIDCSIIHNNKFDYSKAVYINAKTPLTIICPIHGEFKQTLLAHKKSKEPCIKCKNKIHSFKDFLQKLSPKFKNTFKYDEKSFKSSKTPMKITCPVHGIFYMSPKAHLNSKTGCDQCSRDIFRTKFNNFVKDSNLIHNNKYLYEKTDIKNNKQKIKIYCKKCKLYFYQGVINHKKGQGCPYCANSCRKKYTKDVWIKNCIDYNKTPKVYIIRCYNSKESFIKIGITSNAIHTRFGCKTNMPYSYEIIKKINGSPEFVWNKEKELHKLCKDFKYKPLTHFPGNTECFSINCLNILR